MYLFINCVKVHSLTQFVQSHISSAKYITEDGCENQVLYSLPYDTISYFGEFFAVLEKDFDKFGVKGFGINLTTLEDVFLKVGEDHTVKPKTVDITGIGSDTKYEVSLS